jgi:hypothetical protein
MGPLDAFWHVFNLFLPALGLGALASALAKLIWRKSLAGTRWWRLAAWTSAACTVALIGGLVGFGRDGKMATYGAMVLAAALVLWWAGFRRPPARG